MAWSTPRTWVAGEVVTASLLNTHVRDNLNHVRNVLLGTEDIGANLLISTGRSLSFSDPDVAHGMTTLVATEVYGRLSSLSGTVGGLLLEGWSDSDQNALQIWGTNGATSPANAALTLTGAKKSGTGATAMSGSEVVMQFTNYTTLLARFLGSGIFETTYVQLGLAGGALNGVHLGTTTSAVTAGALSMDELGVDPTVPSSNMAYVYAKDNGSGKTQLLVRFSSGAGIVLATQV